ncbi:heterokaryon incompatibility protein-domain-containing protein [Pyrenochaeta sp. MPI-SDFR-AT-0127]|nr:heterokaryon incompatibility protein-domain-containing protein [Pyrenochaeta sp. MPI-SDFR-AT-0127]
MSTVLWILFWVIFAFIYPFMSTSLPHAIYWPFLIVGIVIHDFLPQSEIPHTAFWVLFVLLLLAARPNSTSVVFFTLLLLHLYRPYLPTLPELLGRIHWHFPPWIVAVWAFVNYVLFVVSLPLLWYFAGRYSSFAYQSIWSLGFWLIACVVLYDRTPSYSDDFGGAWTFAWGYFFGIVRVVVPPKMPVAWYVFWIPTMTVSAVYVCRDRTALQLIIWTTVMFVLRFFVYGFYLFCLFNPDIFPFNWFSARWRRCKPRWYPLIARQPDNAFPSSMRLCKRCDKLVGKSSLIMGSRLPFTKMTEWHDFGSKESFWLACNPVKQNPSTVQTSISQPSEVQSSEQSSEAQSSEPQSSAEQPLTEESMEQPAEQTESTTGPPCPFCNLLWFSMSKKRRTGSLWAPKKPKSNLRVKIWEERPLTLCTYVQLYWGEISLGTRILVHRGDDYPIPSTAITEEWTGSDKHMRQMKTWLEKCKMQHKLCNGVGNTRRIHPTRLIYIGGGEEATDQLKRQVVRPSTIKLIETSALTQNVEYVALSHCWGKEPMKFRLEPHNLEACYKHIDFDGLSTNMQHALVITRHLGLSYIWIDSLCIMQGQTNKAVADWEKEARTMGNVYSGAVCTIASTGSGSSAGGCFHDRNLPSLKPCIIGVMSVDGLNPSAIYARRDDYVDFERNVDKAPLNARAWVFQERVLSRRILHFGAEMVYWECCERSASELNHHGYVYKSFPEDFKDNYFPDISHLITRAQQIEAERQNRGIGHATQEMERLRPPPVEFDPDDPPASRTIWQRKRGFWKNVLKQAPPSQSWASDRSQSQAAGFRAAFEDLRSGSETPRDLVGRSSFSQTWYEIVESYSRGDLTLATDKLVALFAVQKEVAWATGYTYACGLWREQLLTDLLWFASEGPGKRLLNKENALFMPTWSWASIGGVVALDLLAENSLASVQLKKVLAAATFMEEPPTGHDSAAPADQFIKLTGPVLPIPAPTQKDGDIWHIHIGGSWSASARYFPDLEDSIKSKDDGDLVCLPFLSLHRAKKYGLVKTSNEDIQGLVLRLVEKREGTAQSPDIYERVGYFTTSYIKSSWATWWAWRKLKGAEERTVILTGGLRSNRP